MNFKRRRAWPGILALFCLIASSFISLPIPGMVGRAYAAAGPDLTIQSVVWTPDTPSLGDTTRFTVTVSNQGDDIAGNSRLVFYIDDQITDSAILSTINPGSALSYIFTWKATAGAHVAKAVADSDQAVAESDENNNEKSYAFSVLAPDLIISSITWSPEKPSTGSPVIFTITVKNQGNKAANTNWIDFLIDGVSRGQREGQPLNPGATYTRTYAWIAQPGQHILKAMADVLSQSQESDETNNDLTVVYYTTPPDLVIDAITWTPVNRTESGNVTMSITVKNQGEGDANGSWLSYYIDGDLQTAVYVASLVPGASAIKTFNWMPGPNEHIFSATIDADNLIFERDESNNSRSVTLPALGLPDLSIQSIICTPQTPGVNSRVTFNITILNSGTRSVSKFDFALYITGGVKITSQEGPIAPGGTVVITMNWITGAIPADVRGVVDENNYISESNKNNNEYSFTLTPTKPVPTADLTVTSITCTPSNPATGDIVTIKAVVKNQGYGPADASSAACYIDEETIGYIYMPSLNPGKSVEIEKTWKATTGEHQVKIVVDANNMIFEINETNNEATTTITTTDPDLAIEKIEWFPTYPEIGKAVLFTVTIKNQGTRVSGQCYVTYYIDGSKQGEHYIEPLDPGASVTRNFSWKVQAATLTFKAVVDEANAVAESNENNNDKSVFLPAPNLTIQNITCSEDYPVADTLLSFTIDIQNTGRSLAGATKTAAYIDGNALAQIDLGAIDAGQTAKSVFYWTAVPGKHTLRVITDQENTVTESNETDNVKEVIIFVPLPSQTVSKQPVSGAQTENTSAITPVINTIKQPPAVTMTPTVKKPVDLSHNVPATTTPDIAANISSTAKADSGGIKNVLTNKLLIFGVAGAGIAIIGVLLFLRKLSTQPKKEKTEKAPKASKPSKSEKPPKPDQKKEKPVKPAEKAPLPPTGTLSGKPPVSVPPPPKPTAAGPGLSAPIKIAPAPLPSKPAVPPANPNLGATLIQQQSKQPPPKA